MPACFRIHHSAWSCCTIACQVRRILSGGCVPPLSKACPGRSEGGGLRFRTSRCASLPFSKGEVRRGFVAGSTLPLSPPGELPAPRYSPRGHGLPSRCSPTHRDLRQDRLWKGGGEERHGSDIGGASEETATDEGCIMQQRHASFIILHSPFSFYFVSCANDRA